MLVLSLSLAFRKVLIKLPVLLSSESEPRYPLKFLKFLKSLTRILYV